VKAGIRTICIHKGLMPADYEQSWANVWQYNTAWDIGKTAKDWPQLNFVIYHGCLQAFREPPDRVLGGAPTPYGTVRRSGRSRRCAGWKSP
jgi:uncharacterized protein